MLGRPVRSVVDKRKLVVAPPEASVDQAARLMKKGKSGAVLVVKNGRLVGIFTERDAVYRVMAVNRIALGEDADQTPILDRKSTRLNSSHSRASRMPSSA